MENKEPHMDKLKYEGLLFKVVQYYDLDNFIKAHYDLPDYEVIADMEYNNDSCYKMTIEKKELSKYDQEDLNEFLNSKGRDGNYMIYKLMYDMCNKDLIEPGHYLIDVSW